MNSIAVQIWNWGGKLVADINLEHEYEKQIF